MSCLHIGHHSIAKHHLTMIQLNLFLTILIVSTQAVINPILTTIDPEHELLTEIVGRYRLATRYLHESQSIIPFEIQFPIHDIIKVDGSTNEYVFRATIRLNYQFKFLHWNSNDTNNRYYDINEIILTKTSLQSFWLPDVHFLDEDLVSFHIEHETTKINNHGLVTWIRRGVFKIISSIDLTYYPFDRQYIRIDMYNKQKTFKLQYERKIFLNRHSHLSRSFNLWTRLFDNTDINFDENNSSNISLLFENHSRIIKPILSRGWFVRLLAIEPRIENENLKQLTIYILIERRRESHIYSTILPTLFFSIFIFIFYFSSIKSYQRLIISLLHSLSTLLFIIHLDQKISAEQLSYTPWIIRYLSIIFLIEILSLFFDHIIHSIYYGGVYFISNWLRKKESYETQPARLSCVKLFKQGLQSNNIENKNESDILMQQLIKREESLKLEDYQQYQWHRQARLSECLCCSFFLVIVIIVFIFSFFISPMFGISKMT